jgi:hypothetical protein
MYSFYVSVKNIWEPLKIDYMFASVNSLPYNTQGTLCDEYLYAYWSELLGIPGGIS